MSSGPSPSEKNEPGYAVAVKSERSGLLRERRKRVAAKDVTNSRQLVAGLRGSSHYLVVRIFASCVP